MFSSVKWCVPVCLSISLLSGCNQESNNKLPENSSETSKISLEKIGVELIGDGDAMQQYLSSSSKDLPNSNMMTVDADNASSLSLTAGEFHHFNISFTADNKQAEDVKFEVSLVGNNDDLEQTEEIVLGGTSVSVSTGTNVLTINALIPKNINPGKYLLVAKAVDDGFESKIKGDNDLQGISEIGSINVTIIGSENPTDINLTKVDMSSGYIDLVSPGKFSGEYTSLPMGSANLALYNTALDEKEIKISAELSIEGGQVISLGLLNNKTGTVVDSISHAIYPMGKNNDPIGVDVAYFIKESDYQKILQTIPGITSGGIDGVKATINWNIATSNDENIFIDNLSSNVNITKSINENSIGEKQYAAKASASDIANGMLFSFGESPTLNFGSKQFFGIDVVSKYLVNGYWDVPRLEAIANSNLSAYIFNAKKDIVRANLEMHGGLKAINESSRKEQFTHKSGGLINIEVLGSKIFTKDTIKQENITKKYSSSLSKSEKQTIFNDAATQKAEFKMPQYSWNEKLTFAKASFMIGPVPLSVGAGMKGSIALNNILSAKDGIGVGLTSNAPANLAGFLSGGIDAAVVRAGVGGDMSIIESNPTAIFDAGLSLSDDNSFAFDINSKADYNLGLLKGRMYLYAGTKTKISWCTKKVFGAKIKYPCGLSWSDYTLDLYNSPWAFNRSWNMLNENIPVFKSE